VGGWLVSWLNGWSVVGRSVVLLIGPLIRQSAVLLVGGWLVSGWLVKGESEGEGGGGSDIEGEGEGDFGGTDEADVSLDELMKKIQREFQEGNSAQDIQTKRDVEAIESALSTSKDRIKYTFKSKTVARVAIGNRKLFADDNEQRINDALNQIFN